MLNHYFERVKHQFDSNIIMNWNNIHKSILVLVLTFGIQCLWIIWKLLIVNTPSLWSWVNLPLVHIQIYVNTISAILTIALITLCYKFQEKPWATNIFPHIVISIFVLMFIADGLLVGLYSPATIFGFVCISGIGLILFNRQFIYYHLLSAFTIAIVLMYCTYKNLIPYAPIFSQALLEQSPHRNIFWVLSMVYFILPILIACIILCEVLLSQWRRRESLIQILSQTDPLTNLYNRRSFNEKLTNIRNTQTQFAIILIDIDHFKAINDDFGHRMGDEALINVAKLLTTHMRTTDIVARYGGEEFIIAMPETSLAIACSVAERCRLAIQNQTLDTLTQNKVHLTASFGIAISESETQIDKIIHYADQALYRAKANGRNQVQFHTEPSIDRTKQLSR